MRLCFVEGVDAGERRGDGGPRDGDRVVGDALGDAHVDLLVIAAVENVAVTGSVAAYD
jgi:hypothetical protein